MASPIPYDYRKLIVSLRQSGLTYKKIQEKIGYSIGGIKKIWYQYQQEGPAIFSTKYQNCGQSSPYTEDLRTKVNAIRTREQGASFVYSMLGMKYPELQRPHIRTIQRWWEAQGSNRSNGRRSNSEKKTGL